ncbi:MAG: drug/metabolite transporter (DMT)-like permease [Parasphingorhabdus sp.]|jgi:drug/metabolite transporter (DMT)-like permease
MTGGFASFSAADLIAKLLTVDFHPIQIVWSRQLGIAAVIVILLMLKGPSIFRTAVPKLQVARGMFAVMSATCFIYAISYVPLADAVAVTFAAPFMVTIFSALILGEKVGPRRWTAVTVGFLGTLVIIRPGYGVFHPAIFLVLLAALAFALRQIISRPIGKLDPTITTLVYTSMTALVVLLIPLPFIWKTPVSSYHFILLLGLALLSGLGEYLIIRALEMAEAVVVTPMHYSLIIFSTFWGYLFFADLPDQWTLIGATIVIASGLYIVYNERRRSRSAA